ncbi:MAG: pcpB, partial [Phycisphaerales bacterium]|nr:pcpB [Phycisphaerales bacterium]
SGVAQTIRNHVASLVFGLPAVRGVMANKLTEIAIGYPQSPLSVPTRHPHGGPSSGARAPVFAGGVPVGAGSSPRFALFAERNAQSAALIARHGNLLESQPRPPFADTGTWLVRPDGYVALVAGRGEWDAAEGYLATISKI